MFFTESGARKGAPRSTVLRSYLSFDPRDARLRAEQPAAGCRQQLRADAYAGQLWIERDQVTKTPADEREMMFGMMKDFDDNENIKVVKETPKGDGAELQVEATSKGDKSKSTATVSLVKEGGAWKLDKESWKGSM